MAEVVFERLNRPPAPHLDLLEQVIYDRRQESRVSPSKSDKENLDRWHRNQGKTRPPKRPTGALEGNKNRLKRGGTHLR
jgi:hypothetical protein